jgi:hypothetical protein
MPYVDPEQRRAWNWRKQRILCPLCPNMMWVGSETCQECWIDMRRAQATANIPRNIPRKYSSTGTSRPQPANHPWRRSLTRIP